MAKWLNTGTSTLNLPGGPYPPGSTFTADLTPEQERSLTRAQAIAPAKPKAKAKAKTTTTDEE